MLERATVSGEIETACSSYLWLIKVSDLAKSKEVPDSRALSYIIVAVSAYHSFWYLNYWTIDAK